MENASKALIIAGSILLSILIIALGMYIFSSSSGVTDDTTLSQMETSTFNEKFSRYKGRQNGSRVSALIDVLITNVNGKVNTSEVPQVEFYNDNEKVNPGSAGEIATTTNPTADTKLLAVGQSTANSTSNKNGAKDVFKAMKNALENNHIYYVYIDTNNSTDLIHGIVITYDQEAENGPKRATNLANPDSNE